MFLFQVFYFCVSEKACLENSSWQSRKAETHWGYSSCIWVKTTTMSTPKGLRVCVVTFTQLISSLLPSCIRCPTTWTGWCVTWQTWKYSLAQSRGLTACSKLNQRITRDCSVSALCRLKLNFLLLIQQALREIMSNVLPPEKCLWFLLEWRSLKLTLHSSLSVQEGCHNAHEKWIFILLALFENSANVFYIP